VAVVPISFAQDIDKRWVASMKSDARQLRVRQYVDRLASGGRHSFSSAEARAALGVSAACPVEWTASACAVGSDHSHSGWYIYRRDPVYLGVPVAGRVVVMS
jgi:hypothetical protein